MVFPNCLPACRIAQPKTNKVFNSRQSKGLLHSCASYPTLRLRTLSYRILLIARHFSHPATANEQSAIGNKKATTRRCRATTGLLRRQMADGLVELWESLGEAHRTTLLHKAVDAAGGAAHQAVGAHSVSEGNLQRAHLQHAHLHLDDILEGSRVLISALHRHHGRHHPFRLHPVKAIAQLVHPVHPRLLHKAHIIRVVRNPHPVALIILHLMSINIHVSQRLKETPS